MRPFYFIYFSLTTNQLLPSSSEGPGPKMDISEGILRQEMLFFMPGCGNLGFPQVFPPGSRQRTGPGMFQLPELLLLHEKQQKNPNIPSKLGYSEVLCPPHSCSHLSSYQYMVHWHRISSGPTSTLCHLLAEGKKFKKKEKKAKKREKATISTFNFSLCVSLYSVSWNKLDFFPQEKALPQELSQSTNPRPCFNAHALDLLPGSLILQSCGISIIGVERELQQSLPPSPHPTNISHMEQRQQTPGIQGISGMNPQGFAPPFRARAVPTPSQPLIRRNA